MKKVLSIIIPTYNMEKYISRCLDSLIIPSIDKLDIIVVNDGSKDSSSEIAHEYENKFPNSIRVIDKKNGNYGSCINAALPLIKGKYVKILDADDTFETKNLEDYIEFLSSNNFDLIITNHLRYDESGKILSIQEYPDLISGKNLNFEDTYMMLNYNLTSMHSLTYNSSIFENLNYFQTEGISYTDNEWNFLPLINVNKIFYYNKVIYRLLRGREGQTMDPKVIKKNFLQHAQIALWMIENYNNINKSISDFKQKLLKKRIKDLSRSIYYNVLFDVPSHENNEFLKEFNDNIKLLSPDIFHELNNEKGKFGINVLTFWQEKQKINSVPIQIIRMIKRINNLKSLII